MRVACALAAVAVALLAGGCGTSRNNASGLFEPYRIDLPQGNYLTREMLDKVTTGMPRDQVRFTLGMPLLNPIFRTDRWDYVFRYQHPNGKAELRRVTILFKDEKVESITADPLPVRDDTSDPALPGYRAPGKTAR
jgi:outer membrane protein assembly factor BamE